MDQEEGKDKREREGERKKGGERGKEESYLVKITKSDISRMSRCIHLSYVTRCPLELPLLTN